MARSTRLVMLIKNVARSTWLVILIKNIHIYFMVSETMARPTRLVLLIKNRYTLWGRKRILLPVILDGVGNASFCRLHTFGRI